ncbi:MAG: P-II family nitrogen regulator, partial [Clostridia bacterium]|nr:P-II family nitrogen regulator [Clostridia bacterium]
MKDLFFLITIVRRNDAAEYDEFYRSEGVDVVYTTACNGTAHAKTLDILGIEKTEKSMLFSTVTGDTLTRLKRLLTTKMKIDLPDRGVAMAVPLSGVGGSRTLEIFTSGQTMSENTKEDNNMESSHELIVAIYERGYTDLVMDAAREAGARGGTAIN